MWCERWSEHYSPLHNEYIKEPINSVSAFIMCIYIIINIMKKNNMCITATILQSNIAINLLSSCIAHGTYNDISIFIDEITIISAICIYLLYEKNNIYSALTIICFSFNDTFGYVIGFSSVFSSVYKKINHKNKQLVIYYTFIFMISLSLWILDQIYHELWYIFGHALFHIGLSYSLVHLIDIVFA